MSIIDLIDYNYTIAEIPPPYKKTDTPNILPDTESLLQKAYEEVRCAPIMTKGLYWESLIDTGFISFCTAQIVPEKNQIFLLSLFSWFLINEIYDKNEYKKIEKRKKSILELINNTAPNLDKKYSADAEEELRQGLSEYLEMETDWIPYADNLGKINQIEFKRAYCGDSMKNLIENIATQ